METRRSQKSKRLKREVTALLRKMKVTKAQVMEVAELFDELEAVHERWRLWGDEWAKDDHPHAIHARAPAVGAHLYLERTMIGRTINADTRRA